MDRATDIGISTSAYSELMLPAALERIAELAPAAEIRSFGLHTLLSERNRRGGAGEPASRTPCTGPSATRASGTSTRTSGSRRSTSIAGTSRRARRSGRSLYVVHPDWRPAVAPRDPAVVAALGRSFETLLEWQAEYGVEIVVENMPGAGQSHFTHPGDLDLRGLGLILDVGHASISGCLDEWLADPQAPLRHLHVHDNHGEGDADDPHLGLGAGVVDAAAVMAAARAAGASVVLEHDRRRAVSVSLARLRDLGLL